MSDGRFKPGYDPRRNTRGTRGGTPADVLAARRAAEEADKARENAIDADKTMPLDFMLRTMRNPDLDRHERFQAAARAAPYCHPQLQAVAFQHLDPSGNPIVPVVTVVVQKAVPEVEQPKLSHQGPKDGETVQ